MAKKRRSRRKIRPPPPPPPAEFYPGDFVLAKVKGWPPWPAKVVKPEDVTLPPKPGKYPVIFFGDKSEALISSDKLTPFATELFLELPETTHRQRFFAKSVKEIRDAIKEEKAKALQQQKVQTPVQPSPELEPPVKETPFHPNGELIPPVKERSFQSIPELVVKAKSKRDWTLDRNPDKFLLETLTSDMKRSGGSKIYYRQLTGQAFHLAELGYASEVTEYMIQMILTSSYGHKIGYLFLLDFLAKEAYAIKGTAGLRYLQEIETKLTDIVKAAAPMGINARSNRIQCLKVLKGWRVKEMFPTPILNKFIEDLEEKCR